MIGRPMPDGPWVIGQVLRAETAGQGRGFPVHRRGVGVKEWAPGLHRSFQRDLVDCIRKARKLPIFKITPAILYCGLLLLVVHIFGGHRGKQLAREYCYPRLANRFASIEKNIPPCLNAVKKVTPQTQFRRT